MRPYRNEVDALRERRETLVKELETLREQASALAAVRAHAAEVAGELATIDERLRGVRRALPMLDRISVASPCEASWDKMTGDDRVRFCGDCKKNVYNLSAMSGEEAEGLLRATGANVCVRFYQRPDGTVMTEDCPVGVGKKRRRQRNLGVAAAGAMAISAAAAAAGVLASRHGEARTPRATAGDATQLVDSSASAKTDGEPTYRVVMGAPPPLPLPVEPPHRILMGKPAPPPPTRGPKLR